MTFEQTLQAHTEALKAHTAAMLQYMNATPVPAPIDTPAVAPVPAAAPAPAEDQPAPADIEALRLELRGKLVELSKVKGKDASFAVLRGFNVEKLPHLRDEDVGEALKAADKALAA